jgi:hypothetical protein
MEPDPLRAEWARWLAGIRRIVTAALVFMALLAALLLVVMAREITRPRPPLTGPHPRETMSEYLKAMQAVPDTQGAMGRE